MMGKFVIAATSLATMGLGVWSAASLSTPNEHVILADRVNEYYSALEKRDFNKIWSFLAANLREDNETSEQYAKELDRFYASVKIVGDAVFAKSPNDKQFTTLSNPRAAGTTGAGKQAESSLSKPPKVTVRRALLLSTGGETEIKVIHITRWAFVPVEGRQPNWYVYAEEIIPGLASTIARVKQHP